MVNVDKIKALAKEKGISVTHLCQSIGQGAYYLNDVKKRGGNIPEDRLNTIADMLGTTTAYLTDETEDKEKPTSTVSVDEITELFRKLSKEDKLKLLKKFMEILGE